MVTRVTRPCQMLLRRLQRRSLGTRPHNRRSRQHERFSFAQSESPSAIDGLAHAKKGQTKLQKTGHPSTDQAKCHPHRAACGLWPVADAGACHRLTCALAKQGQTKLQKTGHPSTDQTMCRLNTRHLSRVSFHALRPIFRKHWIGQGFIARRRNR